MDLTVGARIRQARKRLHLSQDELAAKLGVSRSAVNAWENDREYPRPVNRRELESVLRISLAGDDGGPEPPRPAYTDPTLQRIWDRLQPLDLDDDVKRGMVELARQLLARRQERHQRGALSGFAAVHDA